ncbi:hypothetical protein FGRMN_10212 [Fusarium graminum]|nr:hypothetical protein FGRMN_10212 [Fusarium graminum]
MSKLVDDVKAGLKGIRGAGDALRGEVLDKTDQAFDTNPNHPETLKAQVDNKGIAEKGKQDMRGADDMIARREAEHRGVNPPAGTERPNESLNREPGTVLPGETSHYGTGRTAEDPVPQPGTTMPR